MTELNPKFTLSLTIGLIFLFALGFIQYEKGITEKQMEIEAQHLAEQKVQEDAAIKLRIIESMPQPTGTPYQIYVPNPVKFDNSLQLKEWYNWKDTNASGYKQLNVSATFYQYKEIKSIDYYDYSWGKFFNESAPEGYEWFLAYFNIYSDNDNTIGNNTVMYLPQQKQFALTIGDTMYYPIQFDYKHNQIKQLDNTWSLDRTITPIPYSFEKTFTVDNITGVRIPTYTELWWLQPGKSNAVDGYIIFQIPENYNPRMLRLVGDFWSFGSASWKIHE